MEGERKMIPEQNKNFVYVYITWVIAIWVVTSVYAWAFVLTDEWKWVVYGPAVFILLALVTLGIVSFNRSILSKRVESIYIGRKCITGCQFCPMVEIKDNIVNKSFPVVKCMETAKICYKPMTIPRWCPYAR
jgi:hypothetical protein